MQDFAVNEIEALKKREQEVNQCLRNLAAVCAQQQQLLLLWTDINRRVAQPELAKRAEIQCALDDISKRLAALP